ncbi:MAG: hypothetical protein ILP19_06795 [Oscillospiraceae bacterium]|nr:hypothetical protein [Oscillospiraceae bacterium]
MGHGSYTSADWSRLKESSRITDSSNDKDIFKRQSMDQRFDPKYINVREARDSADHPESTPIIIGFDVTGSMGYLAAQIAKESMNETMMKLFSVKPVTDPQILFAALGDVTDHAPLQVTQFESDIRIGEQLLDLWLEGCGGDSPEDYPLLWYFAAKHTSADSFEKRGKKGYIFTIGDADCHRIVNARHINAIFSDDARTYTISELSQAASEKYELFHIHINAHGNMLPELSQALRGRIMTVSRSDIRIIPELIVSAILLSNGTPMDKVLDNWPAELRGVISDALRALVIKPPAGAISF